MTTNIAPISITEVNISFIKQQGSLIAMASCLINDQLYISSIGIHEKLEGGYRLTYPKKQNFHIYHPIRKSLSKQLEDEIFKKLKEVMTHAKPSPNQVY